MGWPCTGPRWPFVDERPPGGLVFLPSTRSSCDPNYDMKILLGILAVVLVAASLFADYKWRQWMAARRRDRR